MTDQRDLMDQRSNGSLPAPLADQGGPERRRAHRVAWEHHDVSAVELEVQEPGDDWRPVDCTLADLGAGGMGVLIAEPLEPGSRVRITLDLPQRLGREPDPEEDLELMLARWSGLGEVVHTRHTPERIHQHVPEAAHRPHHHGVRFSGLEGEAERQLMNALYGPLPRGWAIERSATNGQPGKPPATRYAVLKDGKRVAWGFTSYDRARSRAYSIHLDEVALARRNHRPGAEARGRG